MNKIIKGVVNNKAIQRCCDAHDICFGAFGANQRTCDDTLLNCWKSKARSRRQRWMGKVAYSALKNYGASAFDKSQRKSTICDVGVQIGG